MNIWRLNANDGYVEVLLLNDNGEQINDKGSYFKEKQKELYTRTIKIKGSIDNIPDIMNYWGISGSCVIGDKVKRILEEYFDDEMIQFFPCRCLQYPQKKFWLLNAYNYQDMLDLNKCVFNTIKNFQGEDVVCSVKQFVFKEEARNLNIFKIKINGQKKTQELFLSDRFKKIMEENNVTGLALEKVYSI